MADEPLALSQADFAARMNWKRSYVTELKKADRLVMDGSGRVLVEASIARIDGTADPSKAAVAERHAAARQAGEIDDDEQEQAPPSPEQSKYQASRAEREHWNAQAARRDYEISMRQLLPAADVEQAVSHLVTQLRARLEVLPDVLAPQLAAQPDEAECRSLLASEIEHALAELARGFAAVLKADEVAP